MTDKRLQVFAIVRLDLETFPITREDATTRISIKEIVPTLDEAQAEVDRLTAINGDPRTHYFWQATRYYPSGRPFSS